MSFYNEIQSLREQKQYEDNKELIEFIKNDIRKKINDDSSITHCDFKYNDTFKRNKSQYIELYFSKEGFEVTKTNHPNTELYEGSNRHSGIRIYLHKNEKK